MRPNNRQRSRGGRGGGGGGGSHNPHKQQHTHNPNRPPNRNQIFDSSGPDVRVRGNAHQVFDKYQALAREASASGDRVQAEAYWQYADHYFRVIQTMGGLLPRNNWGEGGEGSEDGQQQAPQQGQPGQPQQPNGNGGNNNNSYAQADRPNRSEGGRYEGSRSEGDRSDGAHSEGGRSEGGRSEGGRSEGGRSESGRSEGARSEGGRSEGGRSEGGRSQGNRSQGGRSDDHGEAEVEPGLGGVAFLQNGRGTTTDPDPAADDQPDVPEFTPAAGRRS